MVGKSYEKFALAQHEAPNLGVVIHQTVGWGTSANFDLDVGEVEVSCPATRGQLIFEHSASSPNRRGPSQSVLPGKSQPNQLLLARKED